MMILSDVFNLFLNREFLEEVLIVASPFADLQLRDLEFIASFLQHAVHTLDRKGISSTDLLNGTLEPLVPGRHGLVRLVFHHAAEVRSDFSGVKLRDCCAPASADAISTVDKD